MKVYAVPEEVPAPVTDYRNFDLKKVMADEAAHKEALKKHLREAGYTGKHTGGVAQFSVADGYAQYMLADGNGRYGPSFLIHLPYGDAYRYLHIDHLPKKAIVEMIEQRARMNKLFEGR